MQQAWFPAGLAAMSGDWTFNSPVYLAALGTIPLFYVKAVMVTVFAIVAGVIWIRTYQSNQTTGAPALDVVFALLFICSPVINPWYLVWVLVFAALRPSVWAWAASVSVLLSYFSGINLGTDQLGLYQQPIWVLWLEFGAIAAVAGVHRMFFQTRAAN